MLHLFEKLCIVIVLIKKCGEQTHVCTLLAIIDRNASTKLNSTAALLNNSPQYVWVCNKRTKICRLFTFAERNFHPQKL